MSLIEAETSQFAGSPIARRVQRHVGDIAPRARLVAEIAAAQAETTDSDAVFPAAAIEAARHQGLLALAVPVAFGGEGAKVSDLADVCYTLGQACASTAMIYAMHQAALACVIDHAEGSPWHKQLLRRVAVEGLLLASSTTEGNAGGDVRASEAPLVRDDTKVSLDRAASVVSYGAQADGIVTTARRAADAPASDQALAVFLKADYTLVPKSTWQTLGMRGTCSAGFALKAAAPADQMLPVAYTRIHAQTMVPVSHLLWASVWAGIAAAAVTGAQTFVRTASRRAGGRLPPGAAACTRAVASLQSLRGLIAAALARFESMHDDPERLTSLDAQTSLNLLKVEASEEALATVMDAMRACGLAGYRTDGEFAFSRHLRDILSAPIMVHNDRILSNITMSTLMSAPALSLRD